MSKEYEENDDFSVYESDLETELEASRRARRKAKEKRQGISVADTYKADFEDDTIKVKSTREKRTKEDAEKFSEKYADDFENTVVYDPSEIKAYEEEATAEIKDYTESMDADKLEETEYTVATPAPEETAAAPFETAETSAENKAAETEAAPMKKKKWSLKRKFFTILCSILGVYAVMVLAFLGITYFGGGDPDTPVTPQNVIKTVAEKTQEVVVGKVPDRTIVLLMVIDDEYDDKTGEYLYPRTDSIVLANYDNVNKRLTMMSIPRDTIVEVSDETYTKMRSEFPDPGKKQMKINAIYHYGGKEHGKEYLLDEIDHLFGIKPDYTVCVNFEGFNYIVDSIGGVEFDVPIDMVYDDPTQDLHINLRKGVQVLDGDKAQQFVRYRKDNYGNGYAGGDIERIQVQQAFLKVLMAKALSSDTIFKNIFSYMTAFNKYVTTDASINDMARYATILKSIDMSNVVTETLPGEPAYIYGISGYRVNETEAAAMVYNIFNRPLSEITEELAKLQTNENVEKSTDKKVQVLNGGYTDGMASEIQRRFAEIGVNDVTIGTYDGEKQAGTQIIVSREGIGLDLANCFEKSANVIVDAEKTAAAGYDIIVVVGIDEPAVRTKTQISLPSLQDIPLTLSLISGDGSEYTGGNTQQNSSYNYDDYDFDDEDDEDEEVYYEEDGEDSDSGEDEDEDSDENYNNYDNDDEDNDYSDDEVETDNNDSGSDYDDTDENTDTDDSEPEQSNDEPEQSNDEPEQSNDEPDYDYYEEQVS